MSIAMNGSTASTDKREFDADFAAIEDTEAEDEKPVQRNTGTASDYLPCGTASDYLPCCDSTA